MLTEKPQHNPMKNSKKALASEQQRNLSFYVFMTIIFSIIALMAWGYYGNFLPHSNYAPELIKTSLVCTTIFYLLFLRDELWLRTKKFRRISQLHRPLEAYALALISGLGLPYLMLCFFLPALLHFVTATPGQITFTVIHKNHQHTEHKHRNGGLGVDSSFAFANNIYIPTEACWEKISIGDSITLVGKVSTFGVSYDDILITKTDP
jgi:hypothetical protein